MDRWHDGHHGTACNSDVCGVVTNPLTCFPSRRIGSKVRRGKHRVKDLKMKDEETIY